MLFLGGGSHTHSWFYAQETLLVGLWRSYRVPGLETMSVVFKVDTLITVLYYSGPLRNIIKKICRFFVYIGYKFLSTKKTALNIVLKQ